MELSSTPANKVKITPCFSFPNKLLTLNLKWVECATSALRVNSSAGRASPLQGECRGFEPLFTHQTLLFFGLVVQLVRMPPCHGGGHGFKSRPGRQNILLESNTYIFWVVFCSGFAPVLSFPLYFPFFWPDSARLASDLD